MSSVININVPYPAVQYEGTETGGATYFEDREINGFLYRTQNAEYDSSASEWDGQDTSKNAYALTQNADGSTGLLMQTVSPSSPDFLTWSGGNQHRVFDVRDFGALGDDSHNDTTAIQSAADAAAAAPYDYGVVYVPAGKYKIDTVILLDSNTTLQGDGQDVSIIKAMDGINGGVISGVQNIAMIANKGYGEDHPGKTWKANIFIKDISIYGNLPGNNGAGTATMQNGLVTFKGVNNQGIYRCTVQSSANHGISILLTHDHGLWSPATIGIFRVIDCTIDLLSDFDPTLFPNISGFPIRGEGIGQGFASGNLIGFGNLQLPSGGFAMTNDAMDFPGCSGMVITENQVTNCVDGIGTNGTLDVIIADNVVLNCKGYGIASFASSGQGTNNLVISRNVIDAAANASIRVAFSSATLGRNAVISNNVISYSGGPGSAAIVLEAPYSSCYHNVVDLLNSGADGIHCNGNFQTVDSNVVFNGGPSSNGIKIASPQTNIAIVSNNFAGTANPITAASIANLGSACVVRNNLGINPYANALTAPAVPGFPGGTVTNPFVFDCMVYVHGGTGVSISLQGASTGLGKSSGYIVPVGGTIGITFGTGAKPTWVWVPS